MLTKRPSSLLTFQSYLLPITAAKGTAEPLITPIKGIIEGQCNEVKIAILPMAGAFGVVTVLNSADAGWAISHPASARTSVTTGLVLGSGNAYAFVRLMTRSKLYMINTITSGSLPSLVSVSVEQIFEETA